VRAAFFSLCLCLVFTGCQTTKTTDPARTATEQLLLSTAADHALRSADLSIFANRKVFLDGSYFDSYDSKYVLGAIRDALSRAGALLADNAASCDIIMEARSGAFSINSAAGFFGVPTVAVPVPLAGSLQLPQIAFYSSQQQSSFAKIALLAYARQSRAHVYSSGPMDGYAYDHHSRLLFLAWARSDLPEMQSSERDEARAQTWFPQYDFSNLPVAVTITNAATPVTPETNHVAVPPPAAQPDTNSPTR